MSNPLDAVFRGRMGKGSGRVRTPYESKNTLQSKAYVRFVDLLGEGPFEGFCDSAGVTIADAKMLSGDQPDVLNGRLYYDPARYDVEFQEASSTAGAFLVFARVSTVNPLENEPLFSVSTGYPFGETGKFKASITASFLETLNLQNSNEVNSASFKDNADVYLTIYPRTEADQLKTAKVITAVAHGFSVGDIVYRKRVASNVYEWTLLPANVSAFSFQVREVTSVINSDTFSGVVYPVCPEGRARGLLFNTVGSNYLALPAIANPIRQVGHGFYAGQAIEYTGSSWVVSAGNSQTTAVVHKVFNADSFEASRAVIDSPQINIPSAVATAIFFDDTPLADEGSLQYNFANVRLDYRLGYETQDPLVGFEQTETVVDSSQSVDIEHQTANFGDPSVIKTISGTWDELIINLLLPDGLYRQDITTGDIYGLGDNYGETGAPSSVNTKPDNQPPVIRITYRLVSVVNGQDVIGAEQPFGRNDGYVVIKGKTMSPYEVSVRGALASPGHAITGEYSYRLFFYRVSPDDSEFTNPLARRSRVAVNSITGIINARMTYPFCAVVGMEIDAEQFSHIPVRGFRVKMRKLSVPSNYFPPFSRRERLINGRRFVDFRQYPEYCRLPDGGSVYDDAGVPIDQIWDGTFYESWTDNPAWICYSLGTEARVGFADHIRGANKWLFYKIARYCDELVSVGWDGGKFTSKEPRFSCSCYFQTSEDAWKVLTDIASSFAGYVFYQSGMMVPVQDCPRPVRFSFGPANVKNGFFSYTGIHKNGRFSSAVVRFTDPANHFRQTPIVDQDEELIGRLGWKPIEKTAFGCTREGMARRFARRLLISSKNLTTTVKFSTGLVGSVLRPGDIVEVYDPVRSSMPFAGRILSITRSAESNRDMVQLDRLITAEQLALTDAALFSSYGLVCQRPVASPEAGEINDEASLLAYMEAQVTSALRIAAFATDALGNTVVSLLDALPAGVEVGGVWGLRRIDVQPQFFQVVAVQESAKHEFDVVALEYQSAIYDAIDYDSSYHEPPINPDLDAWKRPLPPRNAQILIWPRVNEAGQKIYTINVSWSPPETGFVREYIVSWKRGLANYQVLTTTALTNAETIVIEADSYCAQIQTVGLTGAISEPVEICTVVGVLTAANKEIVSGLELTGQANDTLFVSPDVSFDWRVNWSEATSEFHSDVPPVLAPNISDYEVAVYDVNMVLIWVGSRTTTSFELPITQNRLLPDGPYRELILGVRARTVDGSLSKQTLLRVRNERPAVPLFTYEADLNGYLLLRFTPQLYQDFSHFNVWLSATDGFTPSDANLVFSGSSTVATIQLEIGVPRFVRVAALDALAKTTLDCELSPQFSVIGRRSGGLTVFDFIDNGW